MSLSILTNVSAMNTNRNLEASSNAVSKAMQNLSSGLRINTAADDAAGYAISQGMTDQVNGYNQASQNIGDAINMVQTAESAFNNIQSMLQRVYELGVQYKNGDLSSIRPAGDPGRGQPAHVRDRPAGAVRAVQRRHPSQRLSWRERERHGHLPGRRQQRRHADRFVHRHRGQRAPAAPMACPRRQTEDSTSPALLLSGGTQTVIDLGTTSLGVDQRARSMPSRRWRRTWARSRTACSTPPTRCPRSARTCPRPTARSRTSTWRLR